MCKHVAAALYGVGARLDEEPQLLFVLRGVDEKELLAGAGQDLARSTPEFNSVKLLDDGDVAALFGLEMAESANSLPAPKRRQDSKTLRKSKAPVVKKAAAAKKGKRPRATQTKSGPKRTSIAAVRRRSAKRRSRRSA
jgi:uncharacterized Zn finger protein